MRTTKRITVGTLLAGASCALGMLAAHTAAADEQRFDDVELVVGTFGGSWKERIDEYIGEKFRALGGEINFVTGNHTILLSMLMSARGQDAPMDVVEVTESSWPIIQENELLRELNLANIPNTQYLDERMYDQHRVANWLVQEGVAYHKDKFEEQGIATPTHFSDLVNDKLKNRVAIPDISVSSIINPIVGFSVDAGGDEHNIQPGLERIRQVEVYSYVNSSTQVPQLFESGDIWAGIVHAGWGVRMFDSGLPVCFMHPELGDKRGIAGVGFAAVTANSKNAEAAEWYINMLVSEEMQTILHTKNGIVPTNKVVQEKYAGDPKLDACGEPFLLLSPEEIANLYYVDFTGFDMRDWTAQWNRIVIQ